MPNRDGTGPSNMGPMTGKGFGLCTGGNGNYCGFGRGRAFGFGRSFGRNFINDNFSSNTKKELLEEQKLVFERNLKILNEQIEKL
jgi:hypothetical protein